MEALIQAKLAETQEEHKPTAKFRTLNFLWEYRSIIWIAKDPLNNDMRWIIRKSAETFADRFEYIYVINGKEFPIGKGFSAEHCGWLVTCYRMAQLADYAFVDTSNIDNCKMMACFEILNNLSRPFGSPYESWEHSPNDFDT